MRQASVILSMIILLCSSAYAKNLTTGNHELTLANNVPPGLQKKGVTEVPFNLGKRPPGWDRGLKRGWNKDKNWRWNSKEHLWENKHWKWDTHKKSWEKNNNWR